MVLLPQLTCTFDQPSMLSPLLSILPTCFHFVSLPCTLRNSVKHHLLQRAFPGPCAQWHCPSSPARALLRAFITCFVLLLGCARRRSGVGAQSWPRGLRNLGSNPDSQLICCGSLGKLPTLSELSFLICQVGVTTATSHGRHEDRMS